MKYRLLMLATLLHFGASAESRAADRPNVILIFIDDMGWKDVGCYGNDFIDTPRIDRLAAEGVRFTDFYAAGAVCSPTRCALQSGQNQARIGITAHIPGHWRPFERVITPLTTMALPLETITVAEALKESGYSTGYVGKWHLGRGPQFQPEHQGYDFSAVIGGPHLPGKYRVQGRSDLKPKPGQYRTDFEADLCVDFISRNKENPFFLMGPSWARPFLVALATAATIIASQALISGAFSLTVQAVQMDYLPRLAISHTSASHMGQVYVPVVNLLLMVGSISLVLGFRSSSNLAAAYGIAVTGTMGITTLLMAAFAYDTWKWSMTRVLAVTVPLLVIDLAFFGANVAKIPNGGWFPIVVGLVIIVAMTTWRSGRRILAERIRRGETPIDTFLAEVAEAELPRVPGTAVFLFKGSGAAPPALITNTRHNHVLHERVVLLSVLTADEPYVAQDARSDVEGCGQGVFQVTLHYGFMEEPDVEAALLDIDDERLPITADETVIASSIPGMADWRERLFAVQLRSAASAARFFRLPADRVVEVGSQVEI